MFESLVGDQMNTKQEQAANTFKQICKALPHNRNKVYAKIHLTNSRCDVYMPIRANLVEKASEAKNFWEKLANLAEL